MIKGKCFTLVAITILSLCGFSFAQNQAEKSADKTTVQNSNADTTCQCDRAQQDKATTPADSPKLKSKKNAGTAEENYQISQACRDAVEREAEAAKESLVRWR